MTIRKAVDASPELRSKKTLIEAFIASLGDGEDVMAEWNSFVTTQRESDLAAMISEEHLSEAPTRTFLENAFREGEIKTVGTDIDQIIPRMSRFGGGRDQKKKTVIDKLKAFFEKYFGIGGAARFSDPNEGK